ncbi:thiamine pyrophosphate-binding protein [Acuticoccus sp. MNP-M23]|uniref:thiamine pyrophosphate-binding protein n=1 Tax=Acuticoccus sp. MNP-M23 TaxID=3072793 RepID=UPI0028161E4D|nr:thiamine pyrophosphate-binding protein [Acuticoccus sp. MNP-M23]WMS40875.1 thiamine pyrophosphate-binding protein [Acuticoccus sp. MNP-M23]
MTLRNADIIARKLAASGCSHAYGIPGGEVLTIIDALTAAGIAFHLTKHENFAGFMAEGTWHATGAPAILVATIGPGLANAVNVIANAHQDRVPLIVLTGCLDAGDADTYTHQVFDHQALLAGIVKATFRAATSSLNQVMDKALVLAATGQPGPVHIDVPIRVAEEAARGSASAPAGVGASFIPADGPELQRARKWLGEAERPLVIAGLDAVNDGASDALVRFARSVGAPVITTYKGKGLIAETDALAIGGAGLSPLADKHLMPLIAKADCIVLAGYDPIEMRAGWRDPWPDDARVIDVTPVVRTHGMHSVQVTLYGSVSAVLDTLTNGSAHHPTWPDATPRKVRNALRETFAAETGGWGPAAAFHALRKVLPAETVITADSGAHRILLSQIWDCPAPRTMLQSSALCTMGCAVALAAGHKQAAPETPVTAFVGDAGLEMVLGDLATVRDLGLAVPVVVLIDDSLSLIEMKQRGQQLGNTGVDFSATDLVAVAGAMGGHGVWIDDTETLASEAAAALSRPTFTLLCVRIGRRAYDGKF